MQKIKYRAWQNKMMHTVSELSWMQGGLKFYGPGAGEGIIEANSKFDWEVDTILMQFTSLKDKNETEIYEGDIIYHTTLNTYYIVEWIDKTHEFRLHNKSQQEYLEVIGNVHENPELLEKRK